MRWAGDAMGHLLLEQPERIALRDPWRLIGYVQNNASRFSDVELFTLGVLALFMAIRAVGPTKRGPLVIHAADRGLGSWGPVHPVFHAGVDSLRDRLVSVRSEDQPTVQAAAFQIVRAELELHGWCEPAG